MAERKSLIKDEKVENTLKNIKYKIMVISGKGGVGKSFITANLAMAAAMKNYSTGILDADIHGPTIPRMLGLRSKKPSISPIGILPVSGPLDVKVISMDFLIPDDDSPVIWRGPLKTAALKQFIADVLWGKLDMLFIDLPPGTGDESLSIAQMVRPDYAVVVTLPSEVSSQIVRKVITFSRILKVPILGVIENMSYYKCSKCGAVSYPFGKGGGLKMAKYMNTPFLGGIPIVDEISEACDKGEPYILNHKASEISKIFFKIIDGISGRVSGENQKDG